MSGGRNDKSPPFTPRMEILLVLRGLPSVLGLQGLRHFWQNAKHSNETSELSQLCCEGTLTLSRTEVLLATMKLVRRGSTLEYLRGDLSYILMGTLPRRPVVDKTDSAFQAFARLLLANDTDMFLERLVCINPRNPADGQYWQTPEDVWDIHLWHFHPICRVSGVGYNDTLLVDGVLRASIQ